MHRDRLAEAARRQLHAAFESAGDHAHESDAVAVLRVHVGLDLEHEAGDLVTLRVDRPLLAWLRPRRRGILRDGVDQFGDTEVLQCRAEIDRRQIAVAVGFQIELGIARLRQLGFFGDGLRQLDASLTLAEEFLARPFRPADRAGREIEHPFEGTAHADRPALRADVERQRIGHFVEQLEPRLALAIDLVDESDDRHRAQPADFEQLARLRLDPFGRIEHHHRRIDRRQGAVGVFREVLVARRIEQIEGHSLALEGHDRAGHRDAALLLDLHPVRPRPPRRPARLDLAREMDRAALEQQLFGQRGLARVGMGNDRERAAGRLIGAGHGRGR